MCSQSYLHLTHAHTHRRARARAGERFSGQQRPIDGGIRVWVRACRCVCVWVSEWNVQRNGVVECESIALENTERWRHVWCILFHRFLRSVSTFHFGTCAVASNGKCVLLGALCVYSLELLVCRVTSVRHAQRISQYNVNVVNVKIVEELGDIRSDRNRMWMSAHK